MNIHCDLNIGKQPVFLLHEVARCCRSSVEGPAYPRYAHFRVVLFVMANISLVSQILSKIHNTSLLLCDEKANILFLQEVSWLCVVVVCRLREP